ncbi:MAG: hypothetical protein ACRENI_10330, partial [Gemmatimonadaceae bacterium]
PPALGDAPPDAAPLAHLFDALGSPTAQAPTTAARGQQLPAWLLLAALCASLLVELLSRRLRGER